MSISDEQAALLEEIDDDAYGLYEIDRLYNRTHPEWGHAKRAAQVVTAIENDMLDVFYGRGGARLPKADALAAVSNPSNWIPPAERIDFLCAMTNASGQAAVWSSDWAKRLRNAHPK